MLDTLIGLRLHVGKNEFVTNRLTENEDLSDLASLHFTYKLG